MNFKMKKKSIKKLARLLYEESRKLEKERSIREDYESSFEWCDFDQEVSNKFKKLISNISNYAQNVNLRINEERIVISTDDYKSIKKPSLRTPRGRPINEDSHLEILVLKDIGFTISQGYMCRTSFRDTNIYVQLRKELSERLKQINSENFNNIWSNLMTETGMSRDNNLDEIFNA